MLGFPRKIGHSKRALHRLHTVFMQSRGDAPSIGEASAVRFMNLTAAQLRRWQIARLPSSPNATITGGGLSATVFLPDAHRGYYRSSRFDWGSMVGHIVLDVPNSGGNKTVTLCTSVRPRPHRPLATDHVIGLASEFGCGVHGAFCRVSGEPVASNGVFGYGNAGPGGTFLKLGVGRLVRPAKPRTDGFAYNFTWPYEFPEAPPRWRVQRLENGTGVVLQHAVEHARWGLTTRRKVSACGQPGKWPALCVDLRLTNTGQTALRMPYASGHGFNMLRGPATGPGFAVSFWVPGSATFQDHAVPTNATASRAARAKLAPAMAPAAWATPMARIADMLLRPAGHLGLSRIRVNRRLGENEVASANFQVNHTWDGRFTVVLPAAQGWNLVVLHTLWRDEAARRSGWFGFNVRISRRAVAPRPYLLFDLDPGQAVEVAHRYEFVWRRS